MGSNKPLPRLKNRADVKDCVRSGLNVLAESLYLWGWHITTVFQREIAEKPDGFSVSARVSANWAYRRGQITWATKQFEGDTAKDVASFLLHELVHISLAPIKANHTSKRSEFVTENLTKVLLQLEAIQEWVNDYRPPSSRRGKKGSSSRSPRQKKSSPK